MDCTTPDPSVLQVVVVIAVLLLAGVAWLAICTFALEVLENKLLYTSSRIYKKYEALLLQLLFIVVAVGLPLAAISIIAHDP